MNKTIRTSGVSYTLCVEGNTGKVSLFKLCAKSSLGNESLGSISWVPELEHLQTNSTESQIIWLFRPGTMNNGIFTSFYMQELFVSFDIVDDNMVIVV
jgi:hypothetical protein